MRVCRGTVSGHKNGILLNVYPTNGYIAESGTFCRRRNSWGEGGRKMQRVRKDNAQLTSAIKRQASNPALRRYVSNLPAYKVSKDIPRNLKKMLERVDEAERNSNS